LPPEKDEAFHPPRVCPARLPGQALQATAVKRPLAGSRIQPAAGQAFTQRVARCRAASTQRVARSNFERGGRPGGLCSAG